MGLRRKSRTLVALLVLPRNLRVIALAFALGPLLSACQINYIVKSAVSQTELLMSRVPIEKALDDPKVSDEEKRKLRLAQDARRFAETELGLKKTKNYTSYVHLDRPYVTYVVSAAPRTELTHHLWRYPMVGRLPYRGYFNEKDAKEEAKELKAKGLDTFVRGVSAYSTLGWFRDPILSSMLLYKDHDLVNTIIHETVHATLYISSEADFNERMATFIGNKGTELFYRKLEGDNGPTLQAIHRDNEDDRLFSQFISEELTKLEAWYGERAGQAIEENARQERFTEIRQHFSSQLKPRLGEDSYRGFEKGELNNARLLTYKLYFEDLSDFEAMFHKLGDNFGAFLAFCKTLEDVKEPTKYLAEKAR